MFTIDQNITAVGLREKNLVKVFFSMNNHEVATPEMMLEEARSYVMFCSEADGKVSAYIGLHLLQTGRRLFYAHSSNPFPPGETGSVEDEALCFVEGLGALIDEIDIARLSAEEKSRWIDGQDIFSPYARLEDPPRAPSRRPDETEAVKAESQEKQPSPPAPAEAAQLQNPPAQPEPQEVPPPPVQQAPQIQPAQAAPQPPQAAATTREAPPPPAEESTPAPSASQPDVQAERDDDAQVISSPAEVPEMRAAPKSQPTEKEAFTREAAIPAPERTRPRHAAPAAAGPRNASYANSSTDRRDIRRKTVQDDIGKLLKTPMKKRAEENASVVRRDLEALARLLSSF